MLLPKDRRWLTQVLASSAKVILGGLLVGCLHPHPNLLAALLLFIIVGRYFSERQKLWSQHQKELLVGMSLTFVMGFFSEWIGTEKGWWVYRFYESTAIKFPPWVPIAWAIAYKIFFRLEAAYTTLQPRWPRFPVMVLLALLLPPLGEIIAMAFGTWHYTFQPQFLKMPLQAVLLIACVHLSSHALTRRILTLIPPARKVPPDAPHLLPGTGQDMMSGAKKPAWEDEA